MQCNSLSKHCAHPERESVLNRPRTTSARHRVVSCALAMAVKHSSIWDVLENRKSIPKHMFHINYQLIAENRRELQSPLRLLLPLLDRPRPPAGLTTTALVYISRNWHLIASSGTIQSERDIAI